MSIDLSPLSPPVRLAIAYANAAVRPRLVFLLMFDDRIAGVVGRTSEPLFAQMRIAWWHEAISKTPETRPKGEPLLVELARMEGEGQATGLVEEMQLLLDGWGILAAHEDWNSDVLQQFAVARSKAVFGSYASWAGLAEPVKAGELWALDDLSIRFGRNFDRMSQPVSRRLPKALRPLSMLALAASTARQRVTGPRLIWHALTGW
ncbi:MAG: hypothetical protein ABI668_12905 [Sphingorhabdus sp.]